MENGPVIVDLPVKNGDFPVRYVTNYQRVTTLNPMNPQAWRRHTAQVFLMNEGFFGLTASWQRPVFWVEHPWKVRSEKIIEKRVKNMENGWKQVFKW